MYCSLVSILLRTFRSWVLFAAVGAQMPVLAFGSSPIANPTVPLSADLVGPTIGLDDFFLFSDGASVTGTVILEVAETAKLGQFNIPDFA